MQKAPEPIDRTRFTTMTSRKDLRLKTYLDYLGLRADGETILFASRGEVQQSSGLNRF